MKINNGQKFWSLMTARIFTTGWYIYVCIRAVHQLCILDRTKASYSVLIATVVLE